MIGVCRMEHSQANSISDSEMSDSEYECSSDSYSSSEECDHRTRTSLCSICGVLHSSKTYYECDMCGVVVCCFCYNGHDHDFGFNMRLEIKERQRMFTCSKSCDIALKKR